MKRGNAALCYGAIGALVLAFGCGRQAFALSINNPPPGNGGITWGGPNAPVNKTESIAAPSIGKTGIEKPVVPPGGLKAKPSNIVPIAPPPASPFVPVAPKNPNPSGSGYHPKHPCYPPHFDIGFQFPMPATGHYELVTETVMVEPEHIEKFWVQPEYQTVLDPSGAPQVVKVKGGYMAERLIRARFATIQRQVWVQDSHPGIGFGMGFKF